MALLRVKRWSFASYRPVRRRLVHRKRRLGLRSRRQTWKWSTSKPDPTNLHQDERWWAAFTRVETGVTATEALQLAEDRPFWRTIATAGGSGWTLRVTMMMMIPSDLDLWPLDVKVTPLVTFVGAMFPLEVFAALLYFEKVGGAGRTEWQTDGRGATFNAAPWEGPH